MVMRGIRVGGGFLVLMLILTGCYKIDYDITVQDDGSASLVYVVGIDYELLSALSAAQDLEIDVPDDRGEFCDNTYRDIVAGDTTGSETSKPYDDGKFCGAELTYSAGPGDDPGSELKSGLVTDSGQSADLSDWTLKRTATGWQFELSFPQNLLDGADGEEEIDEASKAILASSIDIGYAVTLPGQPGDHNADRATPAQASTRFEWGIEVDQPPATLVANTLTTGDGTTTTSTPTTAPTTTVPVDEPESTTTLGLVPDNDGPDDDPGADADEATDEDPGDDDEATSATIENDSNNDGGLPLVPIGLGGAGLALLAGGGLFLTSRPKGEQGAVAPSYQPIANAPTVHSQGFGGPAGGGYQGAQPAPNPQAQQAVAWTPIQEPAQGQPVQAQPPTQHQANPAGGQPHGAGQPPGAGMQTFTEPEWDAMQGCWLVRDNHGVSYRHDDASNQWVPIA